MKEMEICDFRMLVEVALQISSNLQKSWKTGIYQFPFHIFADCEDSLSGMVCLQDRKSHFILKLPFFKKINVHIHAAILCHFKYWKYFFQEKIYLYLCYNFVSIQVLEIRFSSINKAKNCKISLYLEFPFSPYPDTSAVLRTTTLVSQGLILLRFLNV